jgi:phosphate starvation-inducible protein PhoH
MRPARVESKKNHPKHVKTLPPLLPFQPKTENQARVVGAYKNGQNVVMSGMAGTGKTFVALSIALQELARSRAERVVIFRSAVPTRDMGFMPGTLAEKQAPYETPYRSVVTELYGRSDAYDILKKSGVIEFSTTSYLRGLTIKDSVIIVDESQNMTFHEADSIMTRIGDGTRIIFCGDYTQSDLVRDADRHGIRRFFGVLSDMSEFSFVEMGIDDIVRSDIIRSYILAKAAREQAV